MVEDRFNDINVTIINNRGEIEMDLLGKQKLVILNKARN